MKQLTVCICLTFVTLINASYAAKPKAHPQNLFVKLRNGQSLYRSPLILKSKRLIGNLYLVKSDKPEVLSRELREKLGVEYVQRDFIGAKRLMPKIEKMKRTAMSGDTLDTISEFNDPDVGRLWGFGSAGMDVTAAYQNIPFMVTIPVTVAVVDTGVDHNHEDLAENMWRNQGEIPGDGIDNDNNGYIDDIHGINTLVRDANGNATMDTMASHWHGTHVAGTIGAIQNNNVGIAGVANSVKIMAIRTVPDDADELDSDIVEGFIYAAKHGARIINCSFGKNHNEGGMAVRDVINEIGEKYNVLVIAAAGNDYGNDNDVRLKYPASFDSSNLLVVAATTSMETISSFSNLGVKTVDVAAPGSQIYSTINNNKYGAASGTSMATPNTAGVAAKVLSHFPHLSALQLKKVLMDSVTPVASYAGKMVTGGRINLKNALKKAQEIQ